MKKNIEYYLSVGITAGLLYGMLVALSCASRAFFLGFLKPYNVWVLGAPGLGSCVAGLLALSGMIVTKTWSMQGFEWAFFKIVRFFYFPTLAAALFWSSTYQALLAFVSLGCMALFWLHPVGWQAFPYALYWCIPVIVWLFNKKSSFATALGSTFVAHALGSVIFLYAMPLEPAYWLALIPVVALERLGAVGLMLILHALNKKILSRVERGVDSFS